MRQNLEKLRRDYANARYYLGFCNKINVSTKTRSMCMAGLNRCRHALQAEIKRVSWLLWPETGRPGVSYG